MQVINNLQSSLAKRLAKARAQKGFTLIELGIVIVILTVLAALAIPAIRTEIIKGRVSSTADDTVKAIVALKNIAGTSQVGTPFAGLTGQQVQALFRNSNQKLGAATAAVPAVNHSLGGAAGNFSYAVTTVTTAGDSVVLAINGVNEAACANLATSLSKAADAISIQAIAAPGAAALPLPGTNVKAVGGNYNPTAAQGACGQGDINQIYVQINAA